MAKDSRGGKGGSAGGIKKNPDEYRKFLKNKIATAKESLNEERNRENPDSDYMQKLKDKIKYLAMKMNLKPITKHVLLDLWHWIRSRMRRGMRL